MEFGKHSGKSLPQIVLATDPDWFFWAYEQGVFSGWYGLQAEADRTHRRATSIRPPRDHSGQPFRIEYLIDPGTRRFAGVQLVPAFLGGNTHDRIDMSMPRQLHRYDKTGSKILILDVKEILFEDRHIRMTRARCDAFFDCEQNFLTP